MFASTYKSLNELATNYNSSCQRISRHWTCLHTEMGSSNSIINNNHHKTICFHYPFYIPAGQHPKKNRQHFQPPTYHWKEKAKHSNTCIDFILKSTLNHNVSHLFSWGNNITMINVKSYTINTDKAAVYLKYYAIHERV